MTEWVSDDGTVRLIHGDCLAVLPTIERGSVDAVVTDPPYGVGLARLRLPLIHSFAFVLAAM